MTILLTCPRAPVTIEWIKIANRGLHQVILVDSLDYPISKFYKNTTYIKIPSPRIDLTGYQREMEKLFLVIDMVIPNCEDIFFLSKLKDTTSADVLFFMPDTELLFKLHHKLEFFSLLNSHVKIPESKLIRSKKDIKLNEKTVLKPVYSRFGRDIIRDVNLKSIENIVITLENPWVQQKYIHGTAICNYAVCEYGKVISHVVYKPMYLLNHAASTYFEYYEDTRCEAFIIEFAKLNNYHGQVAFDYIDDGNDLYVLECNPRATSGLHLISNSIEIKSDGRLNKKSKILKKSYRVGVSLYVLFGFKALLDGEFMKLHHNHKGAKDALDGLPFYSQFLSLYEIIKRAFIYRKHITSASTFDIEYDGEKDE
ncbi:ATP-grasp domain-containing protein [Sulfurimonas sp.]|uniref:ATP-grasp domain-containing protein n=1 Tax=Sulfurimonas sp. TaxID=2022749 RepID=UPI002610AD27|nr:ATP-grasp domain-containing protein [Sulfurimonas sp.]MCW8895465.1 ATP-grasp domain-containing protein [Sulfurimonas sp.]